MISDTDRLNWLETRKGLELVSDNSIWIKPNGEKFKNPFRLAANGTQYSPAETLRDIIDSAIENDKLAKFNPVH